MTFMVSLVLLIIDTSDNTVDADGVKLVGLGIFFDVVTITATVMLTRYYFGV